MTDAKLAWQSKLVLLAVVPFVGTALLLESYSFLNQFPRAVTWTLGLSAVLGLVTWKVRAATPAAAATGTIITGTLMFSTTTSPYQPWHSALIPVLSVSLLAFAATRLGRRKKERLGTAEATRGRVASQVAANLGVPALVSLAPVQIWLADSGFARGTLAVFLFPSLAALAEAAADTVSSEIGQVLGGRPRMITSFKVVEPGRDGAVSLPGTLAGVIAAAFVSATGAWALRGDWILFTVSCVSAVFGLLFDSLLGATLEEWGWLNNDAVNFLSTASAAGFALLLLAFTHPGVG